MDLRHNNFKRISHFWLSQSLKYILMSDLRCENQFTRDGVLCKLISKIRKSKTRLTNQKQEVGVLGNQLSFLYFAFREIVGINLRWIQTCFDDKLCLITFTIQYYWTFMIQYYWTEAGRNLALPLLVE